MISFAKIFTFTFMIAVAGQLIALAGIFPYELVVELNPVIQIYEDLQKQLAILQGISGQDILSQIGSYGYVSLLMIQLVLSITLLAPIFTGNMLNAIFSLVGLPVAVGTLFTIVCYLSFALWIVDVLRGREVGR